MIRDHEAVVAEQYQPRAGSYVTSAVHAGGEDLDQVSAWAAAMSGGRAIDVGCGGGHVSYRLAAHAGSVVAYDLTEAMLDAVAAEASARGLSNIVVWQGAAERLPFADATFDMVASRFSAHHWRDLDTGLREARRVLAPGGRALFIDSVSPGAPLLDTVLQAVELLRDPSHGRDYSCAEWLAALGRAGFAVQRLVTRRLRMEFGSWTERMATPPAHIAAIQSLQAGFSEAVRSHFAVEADGSFTIDTVAVEVV
jgi:SAM-dependent methyltransferase